jgi:cation diffusion facilitator family transporter
MKADHHHDLPHGDDHSHEDDHPHEHGRLPLDAASVTRRGMRASLISFGGLLLTAVFQVAIVMLTGSVALMSDTIHNFADASTAIPFWIAFRLSTRPPSKQFTYGLGRLEDVAGLFVVITIVLSSVVVAYESIQRLLHPQQVTQIGLVVIAALIGFAGNEIVAIYRIKTGKEIGSAALVADGYHARMDGLTSLAVLISSAGIWLGYPIADPLVSLAICVLILRIGYTSCKSVILRLIDGVDSSFVDQIRTTAQNVPGVLEASDVRIRWLGHRLMAEANIAVESNTPVIQAHEIGNEVRHQLLHDLQFLSDVTIHVDPIDVSGEKHHQIDEHIHDDYPAHSH